MTPTTVPTAARDAARVLVELLARDRQLTITLNAASDRLHAANARLTAGLCAEALLAVYGPTSPAAATNPRCSITSSQSRRSRAWRTRSAAPSATTSKPPTPGASSPPTSARPRPHSAPRCSPPASPRPTPAPPTSTHWPPAHAAATSADDTARGSVPGHPPGRDPRRSPAGRCR